MDPMGFDGLSYHLQGFNMLKNHGKFGDAGFRNHEP